MESKIQCIVGLGNPGPQYEATRHNVGVWFVKALGMQYRASWQSEKKFQSQHARIEVDGMSCDCLIPKTYMNVSGQPVRAYSQFYKIPPEAILVVHDDLDLPVGTIKLKQGGGHGGHNGLRDIIKHLGSHEFMRLRIGIGHPGHASDVHDYVLSKPSRSDAQRIDDAIERALLVIPSLIQGKVQHAMLQLHTDPTAIEKNKRNASLNKELPKSTESSESSESSTRMSQKNSDNHGEKTDGI